MKKLIKLPEELFEENFKGLRDVMIDDEDIYLFYKGIIIESMEYYHDQFKPKKEKAPKPEIDEDRIIEFNEIFPKIKGGSGKSLRCNLKELRKAFEWFWKEYPDYTWENIYQAAYKYVQDQEEDSFKFCRTAKYFIVKWQTPSMCNSLLAEYVTQILAPEYFEDNQRKLGFEPKIL